MKALKEFDYNLWTTEENGVKKYFVGVKATGEVTEVDAEVMKVLNAQEYDYCTGDWKSVGTSIYDNLEAIKEALFYEYDFYCEENAELDKHGDEIYKET